MHPSILRMFDLTGQVALIVGGARDLGFDSACVLAGAGADVILTSRQQASAVKSAAKLSQTYGIKALGLALDHTDPAMVQQVAQQAFDWQKRLDILVNCAGGGSGQSPAKLFERSIADIDQMLRNNLNGTLYCCQAVGRYMAQQKRGKIINFASIAGLLGRDRRMYERNGMKGQPVDYAASKAGVIGLTRDLAGYLSPMGIHVNCVSPGGFQRELPTGFVKDYSDRTPMGRMGRDGIDLNGAILFLASAASDYVTGQNLVVDGGFSIWH